ncbi:MAG: protein-L-isoaspartate O-methyltransferase [Mitsuaria chitosanitabida]|uniref:protein-L-isoaspartate O-methyltransferase family protein n=1 Tax=Roseateles chitosanitabidus TaxID=65048 RepID=UPI001B069F05|nr:protein-L-isoaspartate O-methyltransferase [Roseateles chitosanitabidus]MBO9685566.1 protein-L-isoaspartate O-methyltransferase [Roseateles chitosanitabidus]
MNFEQARFNMIEQQIRPWDVLDPSVLALLAVVKREDFVPAAYRNMAFTDVELPLGNGQKMLPPRVEARWMQELQIERHEKVLEIGTGSGYMAALLGHKAQQVFTVEQDEQLAAQARDALRRNGVLNVTVTTGDGVKGLPSEAPFDVILLSGSVPQAPQALLDQLKIGGRMGVVVGDEPAMTARIITRVGEREFKTENLFETVVQRLDGFDTVSHFTF